MKLDQILGEYFCQQNKIDINEYYKIEEIDAKELLVPERIDFDSSSTLTLYGLRDVNEINFMTVSVMKKNRNEKMDQFDIKKIDSVLNRRNRFKLTVLKIQSWAKRKVRNLKHNSRKNLVLLIRKIGLYKEFRAFYYHLRDIVK